MFLLLQVRSHQEVKTRAGLSTCRHGGLPFSKTKLPVRVCRAYWASFIMTLSLSGLHPTAPPAPPLMLSLALLMGHDTSHCHAKRCPTTDGSGNGSGSGSSAARFFACGASNTEIQTANSNHGGYFFNSPWPMKSVELAAVANQMAMSGISSTKTPHDG